MIFSCFLSFLVLTDRLRSWFLPYGHATCAPRFTFLQIVYKRCISGHLESEKSQLVRVTRIFIQKFKASLFDYYPIGGAAVRESTETGIRSAAALVRYPWPYDYLLFFFSSFHFPTFFFFLLPNVIRNRCYRRSRTLDSVSIATGHQQKTSGWRCLLPYSQSLSDLHAMKDLNSAPK